MINDMVPADRLDDCVAEWTADLVAAPLSVRAIKEAALRSVDLPLPEAFAEKRAPRWSGR